MTGSDLYRRDIIAPSSVSHLVEFGDPDPQNPGQFGHWYNYLDYVFEAEAAFIRARHYLDEPGTALVLSRPADDLFTLKVLVFLLMRFDEIKWLDAGGYVPVPDAIMAKARRMLDEHLASSAD